MGDAHFIVILSTDEVLATLNDGSEIPARGDVFILNRVDDGDAQDIVLRFTVDSIEWVERKGKLWAAIYVEAVPV